MFREFDRVKLPLGAELDIIHEDLITVGKVYTIIDAETLTVFDNLNTPTSLLIYKDQLELVRSKKYF